MRRLIVLIGRITAVLAAAAVVTASLYLAVRRPEPVLSGLAPAILAGGMLLVVHHGYLAVRELRWRLRKIRERRQRDSLHIHDVPKPTTFDGVTVIDDAQHRVLPPVPDHQRSMYARGVKIAILPALAVLVAALPTLRPDNTAWAIGSGVAELATLAAVIYLVRTKPNPSAPWVQARTRAELLRREQYLRLARVGPYLNLDEVEAAAVSTQRLAILGPASATPLTDLIPMRDATSGRHWIDLFWTSPHRPLSDLRERSRSYLHYRIDRQMMWFRLGMNDTHGTVRRIGRIIGISLILAMIIVAGQIVLRLLGPDDAHPYAAFATTLALVVPPFAAFLIAIRELYAYRGRSASYTQTLNDLATERQALDELITRIEDPTRNADTLVREFQAFVLHLETALTVEIRTWIMITERDQFEIDV